jgi:hypothetical protein
MHIVKRVCTVFFFFFFLITSVVECLNNFRSNEGPVPGF